MAHVGEEGRLCGCSRFGAAPRLFQHFLGRLGLADVPDDVDGFDRLAGQRVKDHARIGLDPDPAPILVARTVSQRLARMRRAPIHHLGHVGGDLGPIVRMGHLGRAHRDQLFRFVAEDPLGARRDEPQLALWGDAHDHVRGVLGDEAVALFAFLVGGGLGALDVGDVLQDAEARDRLSLRVAFQGVARDDVAHLSVRADNARLQGRRVLAPVGLLMAEDALAIFGMAEVDQRCERRLPCQRVEPIDEIDLFRPREALAHEVVAPVSRA